MTDRSRGRVNEFTTCITEGNVPQSTKNNIKTFVRFRPFSKKEMMDEEMALTNTGIDIVNDRMVRVDTNSCFSFNRVFEPGVQQVIRLLFRPRFMSNVLKISFKASQMATMPPSSPMGKLGVGKLTQCWGKTQMLG